MKRDLLVMGNWKMNGNEALLLAVREALPTLNAGVRTVVFPPYVYLPAAALHLRDTALCWGGQDVSAHEQGAFTGQISAEMLREFGCQFVLTGHSERRALCAESSLDVAQKFMRAQQRGLIPVLCIGETLAQREANETDSVLQQALQAVIDLAGVKAFAQAVIAYEPVWAIGTGLSATPEAANAVHAFIRNFIFQYDEVLAKKLQILYGGSVTAENAAALLQQPDIDGVLVGGASLKPEGFASIVRSANAQVGF